MKKIISMLVVSIVSLAASFALDSVTVQKACESFLLDKNAVCIKGVVSYGGQKGVTILRASEVKGIGVVPDKLEIYLSGDVPSDLRRMLGSLPLSAISSASYANGILTISVNAENMK